jgi:acyl-CoA thioester hydrolase
MPIEHETEIRVRYADTDQMAHAYYSRHLEWFEQGRTELLRSLGKSYARIEEDGLWLPVAEAYCKYLGAARYDELVRVRSRMTMPSRARLRFDCRIASAGDGRAISEGYTIHAFTNVGGKPLRPPKWFADLVDDGP